MRVSLSILIGLSLLAAVLAAPVAQDESNKPKNVEENGSSEKEDIGGDEKNSTVKRQAPPKIPVPPKPQVPRPPSRVARQVVGNGRNFTDLQPGEVRPKQNKGEIVNSAEEKPEENIGHGLVVVDPNETQAPSKRQAPPPEKPIEKEKASGEDPVEEDSDKGHRETRQVKPDDVIEAENSTVVWPQAPLTGAIEPSSPKDVNKRQVKEGEEAATEAPKSGEKVEVTSEAPVDPHPPAKRQAPEVTEAPKSVEITSEAPVDPHPPAKRQVSEATTEAPAVEITSEAPVDPHPPAKRQVPEATTEAPAVEITSEAPVDPVHPPAKRQVPEVTTEAPVVELTSEAPVDPHPPAKRQTPIQEEIAAPKARGDDIYEAPSAPESANPEESDKVNASH